ncbi:MAG: ATP-binding cassette, subfamily er 3 [Patescibacteria group bacterium]|nr:ATP-binding cassette, subfamily er 3 [Patescibacteria group bacterium]
MAVEKEVPIHGETLLRFENLTFGYDENKIFLEEASFVLRKGAKLVLMGPNGAGKSTIFKLIIGELVPLEGGVITDKKLNIQIAEQYIHHDDWDITGLVFLQKAFSEKIYDMEPRAEKILEKLNWSIPLEKEIKNLSGGQKGRLLILKSLISNPDILLMDEPTNNLDKQGIKDLTEYMKNYTGTAIVISHDEKFLNDFTHGIIYVNTQFKKVEQYVGNYYKALEEIERKKEAERKANSQLEKEIQENKDKVNYFALKGGKMRKLASKLRDEIEEMEDSKVEERKDDRMIRKFNINNSDELSGNVVEIDKISLMIQGEVKDFDVEINLRKGDKLQIVGPNGIGKTTFFNSILNKTNKNVKIQNDIKVGYYRQDFSTLDFNKTGFEELSKIFKRLDEHHLRSVAAGFLLGGKELSTKIGSLSEGQKALLMWAYITLYEPGLLIIDEPTNHVNFLHIPVIAEALKEYDGVIILVSHVNDFVRNVGINKTLDLAKIAKLK